MGFSLDTSVVIDLNSGLSFPNRLKSIASVSSLMPHIQGQAPRIRLREGICFLPSDVVMCMVTSFISHPRKENLDRSSAASQFSPTDGASPVVASLSHYCTRPIFALRFNLLLPVIEAGITALSWINPFEVRGKASRSRVRGCG